MSKSATLDYIPDTFKPRTMLLSAGTSMKDTVRFLNRAGLSYPVIAKPDRGERGKHVEKIATETELEEYLFAYNFDIIIQEYIDWEAEVGILYFRMPDGSSDGISSIVIREFLSVTGDGRSTLEELIGSSVRASFRHSYLNYKYKNKWKDVIPDGKKIILEPIGNHNRGTIFRNGNHLINPELLAVFRKLANNIKGFDYGRFDCKIRSFEDMYKGQFISILELNGVNSEPAHIYDPSFRLLRAYLDIKKHMKIIFSISCQNHKLGVQYAPFLQFTIDLRNHLYTVRKAAPRK